MIYFTVLFSFLVCSFPFDYLLEYCHFQIVFSFENNSRRRIPLQWKKQTKNKSTDTCPGPLSRRPKNASSTKLLEEKSKFIFVWKDGKKNINSIMMKYSVVHPVRSCEMTSFQIQEELTRSSSHRPLAVLL